MSRLAVGFFVATVLAIFFTGAALAERVALVIGNGEYRYAGTLANPPNDAAAIADKLTTLDFQVTTVLNADLRAMRSALRKFTQRANSAEIAVIFYAGHGMQIDGENYLIPVDASMSSRADLPKSALLASEAYQSLVAAQPDAAVLILDACRDNPFTKAVVTAPGLASGSISAGAASSPRNAAGTLIGFAAAPGAVAFDGGKGTSPFTTALLQWIDRPGLELSTMLRRVRNTVVEITRGAQVPWVEEALLREVYLYPADPSAIETVNLGKNVETALLETMRGLNNPQERTAASEYYRRLTGHNETAVLILGAPANDSPDKDEEFVKQGLVWLSIRGSAEPEIFERYLSRFPNSPFAPAAQEQLNRIETEQLSAPIKLASLEGTSGILILGQPIEARKAIDDSLASNVSNATESLQPSVKIDSQLAGKNAPVVKPDRLSPTDVARPQIAAVEITPDQEQEAEADLALSHDALVAVQKLLIVAGEYRGQADARFGAGTRKAIASFQRAASLDGDGYLTQATLKELVGRFGRTVLMSETDAKRRGAIHTVAAVAARGAGAQPIVLRIAAMSRNDEVHAFWRELATDFETAHPGYYVDITHQSGNDYKANLLGMLGSDTPPDIMHTWGGGHLEALRSAGFARDLTEEMSNGWALEFRPGPLQSYVNDGHIYGVPASVELVSLWINKTLLAEAGAKPEQLSTWDGLLSAIRALKAHDIVPIAIGGQDRWPFQLILGSLAEQIGGRDAFQNAYLGREGGFLAPAFVEAGQRLRQLSDLQPFQPGYMSDSEDEAGMAFAKGRAAMVVTGNWRLNTMRWNWPGGFNRMKEELVRLDMPGLAQFGGDSRTYGGADGYAVNSKAPDMAVELLRVFTSRAVQSRIAELAASIPSASGSDLTVTDPFLSDVADELLNSSHHQLYLDQMVGPIVGNVVNEVATRLATGQINGEEAAREIETSWKANLINLPAVGGNVLPAPQP
ncbi:extracellular solute-binding protein [Mesorhizobium yinganensis]|uniref:extracellular solute-binding protein n=1 Tax=Mesorhizobium yinganensis TaxID=3157707 RepID=UPI0032B80361